MHLGGGRSNEPERRYVEPTKRNLLGDEREDI